MESEKYESMLLHIRRDTSLPQLSQQHHMDKHIPTNHTTTRKDSHIHNNHLEQKPKTTGHLNLYEKQEPDNWWRIRWTEGTVASLNLYITTKFK